MPTTNEIKESIYRWNTRFPVDRWWRNKHGISIFSKEHRDSNFIDQLIEFHEDMIFKSLRESVETKESKYYAGTGDWLNLNKISQEQIDDAFDRLSIKNIK